jgi:hypothetical protein
MNIEENPSIWQDLEFPEICHAKHISKIELEGLEYDVKEKSDQHKSCGEFQAVRFRVKHHPKRSPDAPDMSRFVKGIAAVSGFRKLVR